MGLVTLTYDRFTFKLVRHLRLETFLPNLGTLGLWLLELFAMYATDGDRRTDERTRVTLIAPYLRERGHNKRIYTVHATTNSRYRTVSLRAMTHTAINCGNIMAQLSCAIILPVCHSYCGNFKKLPLVFSQ